MANLWGQNWTRAELLQHVGHIEQIAGISAVEAAAGPGRGVRRFEVNTGAGLTFRVLADRALDISACHYRGVSLAWASSAGEVHPAYYEAEGLGWLRSFQGGLVVTCGLDQFGAPTTDGGELFGLHGRVSNLPANQVNYRTYWEGDDYHLEISGQIRQTRLFGENLVLDRKISTWLGSNTIRLEDTVTNDGFSPQPHMILYHCNLGFPLISPAATLHIASSAIVPRDADAEPGLADWSRFQPPTPGYREQVFRHTPLTNDRGEAVARIDNPELDFGFQLRYSAGTLPHLFQWKQMGQGAYVLGLEPANSSAIEGRGVARQRDGLPQLEPGESRVYHLQFEINPTSNRG
jgi:hypothetical protein